MKIFLDENMPRDAADLLRSRGCTVHDVRGTDKEGLSEVDILPVAVCQYVNNGKINCIHCSFTMAVAVPQ